MLAGTLLFTLGFALIFTALGATASIVGGFLLDRFALVQRIAGVFVIFMGIAFLLTVSTKWLVKWCVLPCRNCLIPLLCSGEKTAEGVEQQTLLKAVCCEGKSFSASSRQRFGVLELIEFKQGLHPEK